jgi:UDP-glucose 4-epimerase
VGDIVEATFRAMVNDVHGEVFNIGSGGGTTVNQIASLLCARLGPDISPQHAPAQPGELRNSIADIRKARQLLGYEPHGYLEERIDEVIDWNEGTI